MVTTVASCLPFMIIQERRRRPNSPPWAFAFPAAVVAFLVPLLARQQIPDRFTARADLVVADFVAIGKNESPVLNLTANELLLTVDGKPRDIQRLDLVRVLDSANAPVPLPAETQPPSTVIDPQNEVGGRKIFMVFDEDSIRPNDEREAQQSAIRFVRLLTPRDRVAVLALPGFRVGTDLTLDREQIVGALERIRGHLPPPPVTGDEAVRRACYDYQRTLRTLSELRDLLLTLQRQLGVNAVILTSSGLLPTRAASKVIAGGPSCAQNAIDRDEYSQLGTLAATAQAQFFVIQPHGFLIEAGGPRATPLFLGYSDYHEYVDDELSGLETVAGVTGGELFRISANADSIFSQIASRTSAYYLLGFSPASGERDGKPHKISIRTKRNGVTIRSRPTFVVLK